MSFSNKIKLFFSPETVLDLELDKSSNINEVAKEAKEAYQKLIDPDTNEICPSRVDEQIMASLYLLQYLNWILKNSADEGQKARAAILKKQLADIYNSKKWTNRVAEFLSWNYGFAQGTGTVGWMLPLVGLGFIASIASLNVAAIFAVAGLVLLTGVYSYRNFALIRPDMPRPMLWAYNRPKVAKTTEQAINKKQAALAFFMAFVAAAVWFALMFYGGYEVMQAIEKIAGKAMGVKDMSFGPVTWALPLAFNFFAIFPCEFALNFEANKDFLASFRANRKAGKGFVESLLPKDNVWNKLVEDYKLDLAGKAEIRNVFILNATFALLGTVGMMLIGLDELADLMGMAGSAAVMLIGTVCQIAFYWSRAKDQAGDAAKEISLDIKAGNWDAFKAAKDQGWIAEWKYKIQNAFNSKETTGVDDTKQPMSFKTNVTRILNACGPALMAGIAFYGMLGLAGIPFMLIFGFLAAKGSMTATAGGSPKMYPLASVAAEMEKPAEGLTAENEADYASRLTTYYDLKGGNYRDEEDFGFDLNYVSTGVRPAA